MAGERTPPPAGAGSRFERVESRAAGAMEWLVASDAFGALLARTTENMLALTKIGSTAMDMAIANLRLAGRRDIARLGRQIARTEDKLELLLQEVERLSDELQATDTRGRSGPARSRGAGTGRPVRSRSA